MYYLLQAKTLPISDTGAGLSVYWPTPTTKGYGHGSEGQYQMLYKKMIAGEITKEELEIFTATKMENHRSFKKMNKMWPTPDANMGNRGTQPNWTKNRPSGHHAQYTINQAVRDNPKMFPTPTTMDSKEDALKHATKLMQGKTHRASGEPVQKTLADRIMMDEIEKNPSLMDHYKDHKMTIRPELPPQQEFVKYLRENTTIKELAQKTDIKKTTIEHWFRKDQKGFSHPSIEDWNKIKPYLKTIKYDKEMTKVQTAEWTPKMWPTPTTQDGKNNGGKSQHRRNSKPLNAEVGGALNPQWVEWLMGYPIGWTDLKD
tara:strand:+ start:51 stop:995 length:945 start_codon:yes stop_codon:yes gene_type:complete